MIAVQDGEVVQVGDSPSLGRFVTLRDAYGNTYVYAELGDVASVYPVLEPHVHTAPSPRVAPAPQRTDAERPGDGGRAAALAADRGRRDLRARTRRRRGPGSGPRADAERPDHDAGAATAEGDRQRACLHRRRQRRLSASAGPRRAGDRWHGPRPRRRRHNRWCAGRRRGSRPAHRLPDAPRGQRGAADRPEADPRRLGGARRHLDLPGKGREPVPRDLADRGAGAARVKAAARAAGAARRRHPAGRLRPPGRAGGQGGQARARDARVPVGLGPAPDGLRPAVRGPDASGARGQRSRERKRRRRRHHRRQRRAGRRAPGSRLDRGHDRAQAADAAGAREAEADREPDELPGGGRRANEPERQRRDSRELRSARCARRARRGPVRVGSQPERVDRAARPPRRDPRPDGRQRALERRDPGRRRHLEARPQEGQAHGND